MPPTKKPAAAVAEPATTGAIAARGRPSTSALPSRGVLNEARTNVAATSDAKRLKKRETDRRCQREARQRTKSRIAYLESLVEEMRSQDTSGQVASLMTQLADLRKERDTFARTLRGIEESVRGCWTGDNSAAADPGIGQQSTCGQEGVAIDRTWINHRLEPTGGDMDDEKRAPLRSLDAEVDMFPDCGLLSSKASDTTPQDAGLDLDLDGTSIDPSLSHGGPMPPPVDTSVISMLPPVAPLHCPRCTPHQAPDPTTANIWAFAHAVLGDSPTLYPLSIMEWDDRISADIPARALADGWLAAERSVGGKLPPLWAKLRQIDETVFGDIGKVERLAILVIMHRLLRYHGDGSEVAKSRMPAWYLARPSQGILHSYALDFFTWPGLRERLVFRAHDYCTNLFWRVHNRNLRILWPGSFSECYNLDPTTGRYNVMPDFQRRIGDISAWTMQPDFFATYPELRGDIGSFGSIRRALMPSDPAQPRKLPVSSPYGRGSRVARDFEADAEEMQRMEAISTLPTAKVSDFRPTDSLPQHDLMWFHEDLTQQCSVSVNGSMP